MPICLRLLFERTYLKEIWSVLHVAKKSLITLQMQDPGDKA